MASMRHDHHDWHSEDYVEEWLSSDVTHDAERRIALRKILEDLDIDRDAVRSVLDVGGGYGLFTAEALEVFPQATAVVHDFSSPMLTRARTHLARFGSRVSFHVADLYDRQWTRGLDPPFDLAISAIAIHNVRDPEVVRDVYTEIANLLRPAGSFLDVDFVAAADSVAGVGGTLQARTGMLENVGFSSAGAVWQDGRMVAVLASR
jgi:ubiquinone/menaquinone biosynthesis C-methylase UbiE